MTDERGSRRHPADKISELPPPIPVQHGFISHPILDPVRGAALTAAVTFANQAPEITPGELLDMAALFEQYLAGEEDQP